MGFLKHNTFGAYSGEWLHKHLSYLTFSEVVVIRKTGFSKAPLVFDPLKTPLNPHGLERAMASPTPQPWEQHE
ncbi:hypothetical protein KKI24_19840 [bacterium]|nr:hypothetical protein [bacterium]